MIQPATYDALPALPMVAHRMQDRAEALTKAIEAGAMTFDDLAEFRAETNRDFAILITLHTQIMETRLFVADAVCKGRNGAPMERALKAALMRSSGFARAHVPSVPESG